MLGVGGLLFGLLAQRLRAHHHPLGVTGEDQHVLLLGRGGALALGIEGLKVHRRANYQLAQLALAKPLAGLAHDRLLRLLKAAARRLDRRQASDPVRGLLRRQIQRPVSGIQALLPTRPISDPADANLPHHRAQRPLMRPLDIRAPDPV